ncbi:MAG: helix-turn-helix domain-containing protein [Candidatus Paceibacterota bacterium]
MDGHDTQKTLRETLKDALRSKGISAHKLAELTDITPHYIQALIETDADNLPPAPYVRGYLGKIAEVLDADPEALWHQYKHDERLDRSGEKDLLPSNRFAHTAPNKKAIGITIIALIVLVYLVPKIASFLGRPSVIITNPTADDQIVYASDFFIRGQIDNPQDKVLINAEEVVVNPDGTFEKKVSLQDGSNTYTIVTHRFLGRDTTIVRTIRLATSSQTAQPIPTSTITSTAPHPSLITTSSPAGL